MRRSTSWSRASSGSALLLLTLACASRDTRPTPPPTQPSQVTLFIATEVKGYLAPCGCSEAMRGGLSRAAFQLAQARQEGHPVHFVEAGDGVFGAAAIPAEALGQQKLKAQTLAAGWKAMGLDLAVPGPLDAAAGAEFLSSLALPNLPAGQTRVLDGIGVVSASDAAQAEALAEKLHAKFTVALVAQPLAELLRAPPKHAQLVVSTHTGDAFAAEESRIAGGNAVKLAQVQSKGRTLLRVDVFLRRAPGFEWLRGSDEQERELSALAERIELLRAQVNEPMLNAELKALRAAKLAELIARREALAATPLPVPDKTSAATLRLIPLESSLPKDATVAAREKKYDADVGALNLAWAKTNGVSCPEATKEAPGFVGTQTCIACHADEGKVWLTTRHPLAYTAIANEGKQYHLDCVGCHVTGWKQPQGVCRIDQTEGRREVGCEMCHGAGSAHVAEPKKTNINAKLDAKTCTGCHDAENSPHFDFDAYLAKILGPGHGR